jgi:hypothetical protein
MGKSVTVKGYTRKATTRKGTTVKAHRRAGGKVKAARVPAYERRTEEKRGTKAGKGKKRGQLKLL